MGVHFISRHAH